MLLVVEPGGRVRCRYGEAIDLAVLGVLSVRRASHVEPDGAGAWWADLSPAGGPRLGPYRLRSEALRAEADWLDVTGPADPKDTEGGQVDGLAVGAADAAALLNHQPHGRPPRPTAVRGPGGGAGRR